MESSYRGPAGTVCIEYIRDDLRGGEKPRLTLSSVDDGSNLLCVRAMESKATFPRGTILPAGHQCWRCSSLVLKGTCRCIVSIALALLLPSSLKTTSHLITADFKLLRFFSQAFPLCFVQVPRIWAIPGLSWSHPTAPLGAAHLPMMGLCRVTLGKGLRLVPGSPRPMRTLSQAESDSTPMVYLREELGEPHSYSCSGLPALHQHAFVSHLLTFEPPKNLNWLNAVNQS